MTFLLIWFFTMQTSVNKATVGIKHHEDRQGNHFHILVGGVMLGSWAGGVFTL